MVAAPLALVVALAVLLCSLGSPVRGDAITGLRLYSDSACTQNYTADSSWQSWPSINGSLITSQSIGTYGPCVANPAPSISSGQFFCVTSTNGNGSNIYSLGAQEWSSSTSCSPAGGYSLYYYFSGLQQRCAAGFVNSSGTTSSAVYATFTCTPTGTKNAAALSAWPAVTAWSLVSILAILAMLQW